MKTILKQAGVLLLLGVLLAAVAEAAQITVTTPPAGSGGVNVQAGPANVQTGPGGTAVAVPPGTGAAIQENSDARQENRIERRADRQADRQDARTTNQNWRMRNYNNRWWYYHPNNSWSYYQGGRWLPWRAANRSYTANQTAPDSARRYSSGYRGPMPQANTPTDAGAATSNTNVLPGNNSAPANSPLNNAQPSGGPAPSDR